MYHAYRDGDYLTRDDAEQNIHEAIVYAGSTPKNIPQLMNKRSHHLCLMTLEDRLYLAPIGSNPQHVLDVGTGTGIWATDIASEFPNAHVIGTDLTPIALETQSDNVSFETDDCCSDWVYPADHFDFIHIRGLFGNIADWPQVYKQSFKHLRPGGYIEQVEWSVHLRTADGTLSS